MNAAKTDDFLRDIGMHPELTDMRETMDAILRDMREGLEGRPGPLLMLPTYIEAVSGAPENEPVIVIDAGGTNMRSALITFKNGVPEISDYEKTHMPGSRGELSKDEFFTAIAQQILPLTEYSSKIGFCFSYPAEITPTRDGIVKTLTKEVSIRDINGSVVGESLIEKLHMLGAKGDYEVTLLNDTVACLLGGVAAKGERRFDGMAGLILGTGFNTCYIERGENISKLNNDFDMIINIESGNFKPSSRGEADLSYDASTNNPEEYQLEKMLAGAYHGGVVTETARYAARAGLFSAETAEYLDKHTFEMPELDHFVDSPYARAGRISRMLVDEGETAVMYTIIDRSYERAAKLVTALCSALCVKTDGGRMPWMPYCVTADGSVFYNSKLLRRKLDYNIRSFTNEVLGRHIEFMRAENVNLAGSAVAALSPRS